jgi:DNA invertase Pin-like site-specific DNA recombinase
MKANDDQGKKVAVYVRVSTDKQELENQERQLIPFCEKSGWIVYDLYRDVISGKEEKRPGFDRLFEDARKKLFDIILFWDLSRFSRSGTLFTLLRLKELENKKIRWKSYQEPYLDSGGDFSDIVISVIATVAKMERDKISERTKAGLERAKARGFQLGRRCTITDNQINRIWDEYEKEGTISRAAKVAPFSKGTVYVIIKNNIRTREEYLEFRENH